MEPVNAFRLATSWTKASPSQAMMYGVRKATARARYGGVPGSTDGTILRMELAFPSSPAARQSTDPASVDEYVEVREIIERHGFTRHQL